MAFQFLRPSQSKIMVFELILIVYLSSMILPLQIMSAASTSLAAMCYTGFSECLDNQNDSNDMFGTFNKTISEYSDMLVESSPPGLYFLTLGLEKQNEMGQPYLDATSAIILGAYWYLISCSIVYILKNIRRKHHSKRSSEYLFKNKI
jgi:hypothetical protein